MKNQDLRESIKALSELLYKELPYGMSNPFPINRMGFEPNDEQTIRAKIIELVKQIK